MGISRRKSRASSENRGDAVTQTHRRRTPALRRAAPATALRRVPARGPTRGSAVPRARTAAPTPPRPTPPPVPPPASRSGRRCGVRPSRGSRRCSFAGRGSP
ncbi:MAG: hypothetical protein F4081_03350 [Dehalococcoidia bacterium]|nr:hypothetical protein [Dehalococcoidia bacterium]MYI85831.1 hypothetical protein [Dehalococcoidia bacterium]